MVESSFPRNRFQFGLQPALGWGAILALSFVTTLLILVGGGKILNVVFPAGAFLVGVILYFRYPLLYLSFTWWLFFLTPLIRRLADYRSGFTNPSPILLAPFLVALVTLANLWPNFPRSQRIGGLPFILPIVGVFYGLGIGVILNSPVKVGIDLLEWLVPVLFGFYLFVNWRDYPSYRQTIERTFVWGILVMSIYGIIQYFVAPEWDRFWMISLDTSANGRPEPFNIRVWGTMDSPGPFSNVLRVGLLLLFIRVGTLTLITSVVGYLTFLLTLVRSAWGAWFIGALSLVSSLKAQSQIRLLIIILVMASLIIPLATMEPFAETLNERFATFENIQEDGSAQARQKTYQKFYDSALTNFVGYGLGSSRFDGALLTMHWQLGWLGTIPYLIGTLLILSNLFQPFYNRADTFFLVVRAIILSILPQLLFGNLMLDVNGMIFWSFLGIGAAAQKYYFASRSR
jgi:hypothetical protein